MRGAIWLPLRAMQHENSDPPAEPYLDPPLGPLPSGRHTYTPEQVARHQRERLIAGIAATVAERGFATTTVGGIAGAAHVSRRVFYQHFDSKEECFLAAFDAVIAHLLTVMSTAAEPHGDDWPGRVTAGLGAALDFFAAEPDLARLCLVESISAGPLLHRRFREVADMLAPFLAVGRAGQSGDRELPDPTEVSLIGGLAFKLTRQVSIAGPESLPGQLPAYAEFLLTPYLGAEQAHARVRALVGPGEAKAE
jgi:AcrR family transcriptional regulator